ncbi:MAG: 1-deoxy-D-xylulose-5-phosphate synthase [Armatimonadetes bacterium]|nr:1-deoxy-D-xylulose-5-phosphate synthase [Armatimonadota bacterium]
MGLLDRINSPKDLKSLTLSQLTELASEVRHRIIETVAHSGGHLAPNLGTVELTIALHYVLDSPRDKIIWDVGHQCYTHKLLTGRRERFHTIRQANGLSGFTSRDESEHDPFGAGHGSTSIAAALGFAKARDMCGRTEKVVAVIGDGALTGGMALAALNQAGAMQADLLVVLNDNEMSIGRNVGALTSHLARLRAALVEPAVRRMRADAARALRRLPLGDAMLQAMDRFRDGLKQLVVPGMLFEEMGFTYLGPIDGHDIGALVGVLEQALRLEGPVLLHVVTVKGKGYKPAEDDPTRFHGTPPFDIRTGRSAPRHGLTYSEVFAETLVQLARRDPRIVAVSAAMLDGTGLTRFREEFPERCFDVGMAEEVAVVFAAGLAAGGYRPVVAIYSTFLQRAYDPIVHDVALQRLPVVFAVDRAGLVGDDGPTHHGAFDLSYLRHIPNVVCMAPRDAGELRRMLATALRWEGPAAVRYPRGLAPGCSLDAEIAPLDVPSSEVLRDGDDVGILAIGTMVDPALQAAELLAREGISAAVINARFAKPLDSATICELADVCSGLVTVEENAAAGGFGSGVLELLAHRGYAVPVEVLGLPDVFVPHGRREELLRRYGLDAEGIAAAAKRVIARRPKDKAVSRQEVRK